MKRNLQLSTRDLSHMVVMAMGLDVATTAHVQIFA